MLQGPIQDYGNKGIVIFRCQGCIVDRYKLY